MIARRFMLNTDPFAGAYRDAQGAGQHGHWRASWIAASAVPEPSFEVTAYRLAFTLTAPLVVRLHVTADEHYELYVDGQFVGRGSERGDERNWFFETREVSLSAGPQWIHNRNKGDRGAVEGKFFWGEAHGVGDIFLPDGGASRPFTTLWWEAGRYVELTIATADEPLMVESVQLRETHYPDEFTGAFDASDDRPARVTPVALRTSEMCSHETFMDCPYFEQLQYVGDARLQALVAYVSTTVEMPEPTRSDCHAWGAHPVYHFHAAVLGVRPAGFGFHEVEVKPGLGPPTSARGRTAHPKGHVVINIRRESSRLVGTIGLPPGVSGRYVDRDREVALRPGPNIV